MQPAVHASSQLLSNSQSPPRPLLLSWQTPCRQASDSSYDSYCDRPSLTTGSPTPVTDACSGPRLSTLSYVFMASNSQCAAPLQDSGFKVAIASANSNWQGIQKHISGISGAAFSPTMLSSPAFQAGNHDKSRSINPILQYYGTRAPCAVLFDDGWFNKKYADWTGIVWGPVDPNTGITWDAYDRGKKEMQSRCWCKGP
jgi:hypothetical protein